MQLPAGGKFIAAMSPLTGAHMLIIEDFIYWTHHQEDIEAWLKEHGSSIRQEGMIINFDNDADRTLFMLRWG